MRGHALSMAAHARQTIDHSGAQALGFWVVWGMLFAGRAAADDGAQDAVAQIDQGLTTMAAIGSGMVVPYFKVMLAEVEAAAGDPAGALQRLIEAREQMVAGGEAMAATEIDRVELAIRLRGAEVGGERQEPHVVANKLRRVVEAALAQGNRVFALRATADLAVWMAAQGEDAQAQVLLAEALQTMPDPTPTADMLRAASLLEQLRSGSGLTR
jgi:predicted ATPase